MQIHAIMTSDDVFCALLPEEKAATSAVIRLPKPALLAARGALASVRLRSSPRMFEPKRKLLAVYNRTVDCLQGVERAVMKVNCGDLGGKLY